MKKFIVLIGMLTFAFISQAKSVGNGAIYCIGIGSPTELSHGGIKFKASLCRVREKVFRNVTVHHVGMIDDSYNVGKKLIYFSPYTREITYDSSNKKIGVCPEMGGTVTVGGKSFHPDDGWIYPISGHNRDYDVSYIVDEDLVTVYGNSLNVSTVSKNWYINNYETLY